MSRGRFEFFICLGQNDYHFMFFAARVMLNDSETGENVRWCRYMGCQVSVDNHPIEPILARVYLSDKDKWDTLTGRRRALERALQMSMVDREERIKVWNRFNEQPEIKKLVARAAAKSKSEREWAAYYAKYPKRCR